MQSKPCVGTILRGFGWESSVLNQSVLFIQKSGEYVRIVHIVKVNERPCVEPLDVFPPGTELKHELDPVLAIPFVLSTPNKSSRTCKAPAEPPAFTGISRFGDLSAVCVLTSAPRFDGE